MKSQFRSKRKVSGKKYIPLRKKRLCELEGQSALTHIAAKRQKIKRVKGGNLKVSLLSCDVVSVSEKGGKTVKFGILGVEVNPANINFTRRNIITKGAIVKTEKGNVRITSRPGQNGALFGVFVEKSE